VFRNIVSSFQLIGNSVICDAKLPNFSERVTFAKRAEEQSEIGDYLYKVVFPSIGSDMSSIMKDCLTMPNASVGKFTVVAEITEPGQFDKIDYRPRTNTAGCFADGLASLQLPKSKLCTCGSIPVVLDMAITP
jgi:hypothetical protein